MIIYAVREYMEYEMNDLISFHDSEEGAELECKEKNANTFGVNYSVEPVEVQSMPIICKHNWLHGGNEKIGNIRICTLCSIAEGC